MINSMASIRNASYLRENNRGRGTINMVDTFMVSTQLHNSMATIAIVALTLVDKLVTLRNTSCGVIFSLSGAVRTVCIAVISCCLVSNARS